MPALFAAGLLARSSLGRPRPSRANSVA